jgi:hypothetical protein
MCHTIFWLKLGHFKWALQPTQDEVVRLFGTMEFLYLNQGGFGHHGNIRNISSTLAGHESH